MPAQVTALIHWQALGLWLKRVPFHHKPPFDPGEGLSARVSTPRTAPGLVPARLAPRARGGRGARRAAPRARGRDARRGASRRLDSPVRLRAGGADADPVERLFRRLATRPRLGLGESYQAGEWESDDLVGFFELLLQNAEAAAASPPGLAALLGGAPAARAPGTRVSAPGEMSGTTTTSATTSSASSSTRR